MWRRRKRPAASLELEALVSICDALLVLTSRHTELLALLLHERETREARRDDVDEHHHARLWRGELSATWRGH